MSASATFHVIFGTGAAAVATGSSLLAEGHQVRFANRSGLPTEMMPSEAAVVAAEALDPDQIKAVTGDAHVIYNCLNVPYQHWASTLPRFQTNLLKAAEAVGARLVSLDNLYGYGPVEGPITEDLPLHASSEKGKLRAEMASELMESYEQGRVKVVIGRASDFYGPGVTNSFLGERAFGPLIKGETAQVIGDPDQPHSYAYAADVGRGLAVLGTQPAAVGQAWHLPHAPAVSTRDMLHYAFELVAQAPKIRSMGRMMLMLGGLFIPEARESIELLYEFERPFLVDDSKFRGAFNLLPTAIPNGLQRTVRWYQQNFSS